MKVSENVAVWDGSYDWQHAGDEWSTHFGGPEMQWYGSLLPRLHRFLPTGTVVEIACGFGRWTRFLKERCERLYAIDLSRACVEASSARFAADRHVSCHITDGKSLAMVPDKSVDFVFSFDSLVHADAIVLDAYISQLPRILKKDGVAFIHHSNLGAYSRLQRKVLARIDDFQARDTGVSARLVAAVSEACRLRVIGQELHTWGTRVALMDCMTTLAMPGSAFVRENRVWKNRKFGREIAYLKALSRLY